MHDLREFTDPTEYKTYEELQAKLQSVLGGGVMGGAPKIEDEISLGEETPAPSFKEAEPVSTAEELSSNDDDEDTMSYFSKLINDDAA